MDRNDIGGANHLAIGPSAGSDMTQELAHSFCSTDPPTTGGFAKATFLSITAT